MKRECGRLGVDSLSRLRLEVGLWDVVGLGRRPEQVVLARLRLGHSRLGAHRSRVDRSVSGSCRCGVLETVSHFLLHCPLYAIHRAVMMRVVRGVWSRPVTESVLLGGGLSSTSIKHKSIIAHAVYRFVLDTCRQI